MKRISRILPAVLLGLCILTTNNILAQGNSTDLATDITLQEWQAVLNAPEGGENRRTSIARSRLWILANPMSQ